jgi:hypothetical protein
VSNVDRHVRETSTIATPIAGTQLAVLWATSMAGFFSRRQIRDAFVLAPSWIGLFPRVSGRTFRFSIHASVDADTRRGIDLAAGDANQKARVLGASVEINSSAGETAGLWGIVIGPEGRMPHPKVPVVSLSPEAERTGSSVFSIAPTAEAKRAALLAWRSTHVDADDEFQVVEWHPDLTEYGAGDLNERFTRVYQRPMSEAAWRGYFAVKAMTETALRRATASDRCRALLDAEFDGHKGTRLVFDRATRVLRQPLYVVRCRDASQEIVGEVR